MDRLPRVEICTTIVEAHSRVSSTSSTIFKIWEQMRSGKTVESYLPTHILTVFPTLTVFVILRISPVVENTQGGYHGYWAQNIFNV
jgi:hypothetical protein